MALPQDSLPLSGSAEIVPLPFTNVSQLLAQGSGGTVCADGSDFAFWLGWLLFAAQVPLCYLPQYVKLYKAGTHIGLSLPNTIAFAFVAFLTFMTFICHDFHATFDCCSAGTTWRQCGFAMAPFLQTVTAWLASTYTIKIFFDVFDRPGLEAKNFDPDAEHAACVRQVCISAVAHGVLLVIPCTLVILNGAVDSPWVVSYGYFCNAACSTLISTHWFLQMHETWRMQSVGSLSLLTCVFSSGGSAISAGVFFEHGGLAVAMPFVVGTFAIAAALTFALWVERRAWKGEAPNSDYLPMLLK